MEVPFSAYDLRHIAKRLAEWERLLCSSDGVEGYRPRADMVVRIEVTRPDDDTEIIGHFVLTDGWLGFQPLND